MMVDLDNLQEIIQIDKSNFKQTLLDFPQQCLKAREIGEKGIFPSAYRESKNIVFSGLGGSAVSGDLIRSYLSLKAKVPIVINRNYGVAEFVNSGSLVFICSYSGDTEETVQAFKDALGKRARLIVITSGGKLQEMAGEAGVPLLIIPQGLFIFSCLNSAFKTRDDR
jgi:glucose/mannose-6-phosphate isomerase